VAAVSAAGVTGGHSYIQGGHFVLTVAPSVDKVDERTPGGDTVDTMTAPLRILLLDTETNGLPQNRYAPISLAGNWPAILQLSWAIFELDPDSRTLITGEKRDIGIALHPSIPWNTGAAAIHGLSETEARRGTPAAQALCELAAALRQVDVVIAHNLAFDKPVIRAAGYAEWVRGGAPELRDLWPGKIQEFCTMATTRDLLRLPMPSAPTSGRFKAPRLNELYAWLYGHVYDLSGAVLHTAASDTHCLEQCVQGLLSRGFLRVVDHRLIFSSEGISAAAVVASSGETV
jgi:DNA polymerase III epsilon subunit-like protein